MKFNLGDRVKLSFDIIDLNPPLPANYEGVVVAEYFNDNKSQTTYKVEFDINSEMYKNLVHQHGNISHFYWTVLYAHEMTLLKPKKEFCAALDDPVAWEKKRLELTDRSFRKFFS